MAGTYIPNAVRRVDIPKPQGGTRMLGIATLTDRLIQQAVHQILSPLYEPTFSDSSYGFRSGRSSHQAVKAAQRYISEGKRFVVDLDLSPLFDRVNHDILMGLVSKKVSDPRVLLLIRRYLEAGMMEGGLEGTPQGGLEARSSPTSFSWSWTENWRSGGIASTILPMTVIPANPINVDRHIFKKKIKIAKNVILRLSDPGLD